METHKLLVHPVRARIIATLAGRELTRRELETLIPEIPSPSLYRNMRVLLDAGVAETVRRNPRRGAEEHVYGLAEGRTMMTRDEARKRSPDDWQRGLDTFLGQASASYRAYLADGGTEPCPVFARAFRLSDEERDALGREIKDILDRYAKLDPSLERKRYVVTMVVQPDERSE